MHALLVSYGLRGATAAEHAELCMQLAPALAAVSGLESLAWLSNESAGRYGGFYVFEHKPSFDAFVASELYDAVHTQRAIDGLAASDFSIEFVVTPAPSARVAENAECK